MAITIKPKFQIEIADDPVADAAGLLTPSRFNGGSDLTMMAARLLGRLTEDEGVVEELTAEQVKAFLALTTAALTNAAQNWTKPQRVGLVALTDGATITPDLAAGNAFIVTLGGNRTIANPSNMAGAVGQEVMFVFRGTYQPGFGTYFKFPKGTVPTFSGSLNAVGGLVISSTEILCYGGVGMA